MANIVGGAPRSLLHQSLGETNKTAGSPNATTLRIGYGIIVNVNEETSQVKVKQYSDNGKDDKILPGYIPIINPLSEVHLLWGQLRKGLVVRLFWRGGEKASETAIAEVIGDEGVDYFLKREGRPNVLNTGPYKLFSGGLLG